MPTLSIQYKYDTKVYCTELVDCDFKFFENKSKCQANDTIKGPYQGILIL